MLPSNVVDYVREIFNAHEQASNPKPIQRLRLVVIPGKDIDEERDPLYLHGPKLSTMEIEIIFNLDKKDTSLVNLMCHYQITSSLWTSMARGAALLLMSRMALPIHEPGDYEVLVYLNNCITPGKRFSFHVME